MLQSLFGVFIDFSWLEPFVIFLFVVWLLVLIVLFHSFFVYFSQPRFYLV